MNMHLIKAKDTDYMLLKRNSWPKKLNLHVWYQKKTNPVVTFSLGISYFLMHWLSLK